MGTHTKLCILFSWLGQVTWLFQHINKHVTLASLTSSLLPPPPPPPAVTTHHFPPHYHRQPVASVQERATWRPRNTETAPKRHQDDPADSSTTTRNEEAAMHWKCNGHDGTHKGGPGGAKGAQESNGQGVQGTPAFFFFFFVSTDIPPLS